MTAAALTPSLPLDPLAELRAQRALLITAIRECEDALSTVVFRSRDELAGYALTELLLQMREHLLLAAYVDRADTVPSGALPNPPTTPPPADPTLTTCDACQGTGVCQGPGARDAETGERIVCGMCMGQGCT